MIDPEPVDAGVPADSTADRRRFPRAFDSPLALQIDGFMPLEGQGKFIQPAPGYADAFQVAHAQADGVPENTVHSRGRIQAF